MAGCCINGWPADGLIRDDTLREFGHDPIEYWAREGNAKRLEQAIKDPMIGSKSRAVMQKMKAELGAVVKRQQRTMLTSGRASGVA